MSSPIIQAIRQISEEKDIPFESVIETVEAALAAAFRKDFGSRHQNIKVNFDTETGDFEVFDVKTVVENQALPTEEELEEMEQLEIAAQKEARQRSKMGLPPIVHPEPAEGEEVIKKFNPKTEIMLAEARESLKPEAEIGEEIWSKLEVPSAFGYMAAQTAKQVITQKLREAERGKVFSEFKGRERELVTATVQRQEGRYVLIDLGRTAAVLPPEEQVPGEHYVSGARIKVLIVDVRLSGRGPEVIVSRTHPDIVRRMFETEIPEIASGIVEIKELAREAGSRSKVAVVSHQENVDPIGACIGQRGTRIQTVISELGGEKVDVIQYDEDPAQLISNALSPAKIVEVAVDEDSRIAEVIVADDELSKAIGKAGQNVRLASKLTGWRINIKPLSEVAGTVIGTVDAAEDESDEAATIEEAAAEVAADSAEEATEAVSEESSEEASEEAVEEATEDASEDAPEAETTESADQE